MDGPQNFLLLIFILPLIFIFSLMDEFVKTFQQLINDLVSFGGKFEEWKLDQQEAWHESPPAMKDKVQEFTQHYQQIIEYTNQLAYFFFREEIQWNNFLKDSKQTIADPFFKYQHNPLNVREAQSLHLLHQYAWYQMLKKVAVLNHEKGSLVFLLPPSGVKGEQDEPDFLPECILMEANLYKEQPIYFCWHIAFPSDPELKMAEGEAMTRLYDLMMENFPPKKEISLLEYLEELKISYDERKKQEGGFVNTSTFAGSRSNPSTHVYFLYWTEFFVYSVCLDRASIEDKIEQNIRKNSMIPLNTVFCEGSEYRKFRLDFEKEIAIEVGK